MITLELPWPPSVNTYWRSPNRGKLAGRTLISERGRRYRREAAQAIVACNNPKVPPGRRLSVTLLVYPPDRRRRDLDNLPKGILDALTHAGVIEDDSLIDRLQILRCNTGLKGGGIHAFIEILNENSCLYLPIPSGECAVQFQ